MTRSKAEKIYQKKYRQDHPEFDKNYRRRHWVLRLNFTTAEGDRLRKVFGTEVHQIARRLIRVELMKRELLAPEVTTVPH